MDSDRVQGTVKNIVGQAEDAVGSLTGNLKSQTDGLVDRATGTAQNAYGRAKDSARDMLDRAPDAWSEAVGAGQTYGQQGAVAVRQRVTDQPLAALVIAGALGYLLAWSIHGRT